MPSRLVLFLQALLEDPHSGVHVVALGPLARELGWRFTVVVALDAWEAWYDLARALGVPVAAELAGTGPDTIPFFVARHPSQLPHWEAVLARVAESRAGAVFALGQSPAVGLADLIGFVGEAPAGAIDLPFALEAARHPESRLAGRRLG